MAANAKPLPVDDEQLKECYPLFLGGSSLQGGLTNSSIHPMSCIKLKCTECDKRVIRFLDMQWKQSVDMPFLQENSPNPLNL